MALPKPKKYVNQRPLWVVVELLWAIVYPTFGVQEYSCSLKVRSAASDWKLDL